MNANDESGATRGSLNGEFLRFMSRHLVALGKKRGLRQGQETGQETGTGPVFTSRGVANSGR